MLASRTVTATGHGSVRLPRSTAVVRVAAVHRAEGLAAALAGAESTRAAIVEVARAHVEPTAIATRGFNVWHHDDGGGRRPAGFEARHTLSLDCPDLAVAGALVQALADQVGDRLAVDGVTLHAVPSDDDLRTARERAFADARARAEHLAGLAGAGLGSVVSVAEGGAGASPGPELLAKAAAVDLEPGEADLGASVTVTWELG